MADMTYPALIKFSNEQIRPMAENLRDLKHYLDDMADTYQAEIGGLMSGNANDDVLVDGRAGQGVSQLTKADINSFLSVLGTLRTALDQSGVMDTVRKPTVRPLRG
jgi:hypothetical protein